MERYGGNPITWKENVKSEASLGYTKALAYMELMAQTLHFLGTHRRSEEGGDKKEQRQIPLKYIMCMYGTAQGNPFV
jgi:hypothetical protein